MKFRNRNHQAIFNTMKDKLDHTDKAKMSVLYLLTSDVRLWSVAKHHVFNGHIHLDRIYVRNCNEKTYTLFCCAKDMAYGTDYLSISDLANMELISPKLFGIIITAIGIRRNGL